MEAPSGADVQTVQCTSTKERKTNRPILSLIFSRASLRIDGDEQVYLVTRIITERSGTCCSPNSQTWNGQDQVVTVGARENPVFFLSHSLFLLSLPSSSRSHASVCACKKVSACTSNTSTCFQRATPQHTATQHNTATQNTPHRSEEKRRRDEREERRKEDEREEQTR